MDEHDARVLAAGLMVLALGCAAGPPPETPPEMTEPPPVVSAPEAAPQTVTPAVPSPPAEEPVAIPARDQHEVVIDAGGDATAGPQGLAAAAHAERRRRQDAGTPMITIDDKNLKQHATGSLTIASGAAPAETAEDADETAIDPEDEERWRHRVRTLREQWALAVESIQELEERVASLRTRFYSADDPYVRDGQIKPAWDHALESLEAARKRASELEERLAVVLEEGQQAGALPGWLRDGVDLEPSQRPYQAPARRPKGEPDEGEALVGEPVESDGR